MHTENANKMCSSGNHICTYTYVLYIRVFPLQINYKLNSKLYIVLSNLKLQNNPCRDKLSLVPP